MKRILKVFILFTIFLLADEEIKKEPYIPKVDCLVLKEKMTITCKFTVENKDEVDTIKIVWKSLKDETKQISDLKVEKNSTKIFDRRALDDKKQIKWDFDVVYQDRLTSMSFESR